MGNFPHRRLWFTDRHRLINTTTSFFRCPPPSVRPRPSRSRRVPAKPAPAARPARPSKAKRARPAKASAAVPNDRLDRPAQPAQPVDYGAKLSDQKKDGGRELVSKSHRIRTLEQLLAYAEVDERKWKVDRFVVNKWDIGAKDDTGQIVTEPLFQVKAWLVARVKEAQVEAMMDDLLADMRKFSPKYPRLSYKEDRRKTDGHLGVFAIPDLHMGKLTHVDETGSNYDCKIAARLFMEALEELMVRTKGFKLDRILFPVGNDFFNVDNEARTTTGGTPQDEDGRWQKTFALGRELLVRAIDKLSLIAPVDVVVVVGNHDAQRMWYLGDVLAAWYRANPQVKVFNQPTARKYYEFGRVLIGLTHGDKEKMKDLPLIMATENSQAWARTEWREFHLGHRHQRTEHQIGDVDEFRGVRVRRLSSLTAPDAWHARSGYASLRSAEVLIYSSSEGCVGTFAYNLRADRKAELSK